MITKKLMSVIIVMIIFLIPSAVMASDAFLFSAVGGIAPIAYEENGEKKGLCYDLFREVSKKLKLDIKIQYYPFKRMWGHLKEGTIDGSIGIYYKTERTEHVIFSDQPIYYVRYSIFVKKGKEFDFKKIEDLYGKTVGIQSGWFVSDEFNKAVRERKILVEETAENESNLKKLNHGRIDAFIGNYYISMYTLKQIRLEENIVALPNAVTEKKGVYWAISKKAKSIKNKSKFIEKVNKAIEEIHYAGILDIIEKKYIR